MDVGFRQFSYRNNTTPSTQRNDNEVGQVLAGPIVEVWPTTLPGSGRCPAWRSTGGSKLRSTRSRSPAAA